MKERNEHTDRNSSDVVSGAENSSLELTAEQRRAVGLDKRFDALLDAKSSEFDPNVPELITTWSTYARKILCVNPYPNGITVSIHDNLVGEALSTEEGEGKFRPDQFHLRFRDTKNYQLPGGKYFLYKKNYFEALEHHLSTLHRNGELSSTVVYFGMNSDPFLALNKKFDITVGCLELFEQYRPGFIVVQTRSPMVISGLPIIKMLGDSAVVAMPVETFSEKAVARYTPGQPKISERLIAAKGLRRQGIRVNIQASPLLPYGEFYRDAWDFADLLDKYADYVSFGCLSSGSKSDEKQLRSFPVAQKLVSDGHYHWLRPHSYRYVYYALSLIAPEKLLLPAKSTKMVAQLDLFAA